MYSISRRGILGQAAAIPLLCACTARLSKLTDAQSDANIVFSRVRPTDASWPSPAKWEELNGTVGARLMKVQSPVDACKAAPRASACNELFKELKNPYYIGDAVALTQTTGWVDAWTSTPSVYAVAARQVSDVVAAVNFARENRLRLVVKGGGHSYLGTSNSIDSLLIWTRPMSDIVLHDDFVAQGCAGPGQAAVTVGAGAIWMHTYNEVTTKHARYVQGGGCGTVGVAGLVQGWGFGTYSKAYGTAAAGLLQAEVVTADGVVRTVNDCTNPDLFWALKGGGGGTFGVVTKVTLRTRELPSYVGVVAASIKAVSDAAFQALIARFVRFYADNLLNPHWGEIVNVKPGRVLDIHMEFIGMDQQQALSIWRPFFAEVAVQDDLRIFQGPLIRHAPASKRWDAAFLDKVAPGAVLHDDRAGAPQDNVFWSGNLSEAGHFIHGFESAWLPASLLRPENQSQLVQALFAASQHSIVEIHFQKGLAGASQETIAAVRNTAMNPAVVDAFALVITGSEGPPAYPGLVGHEPDLVEARRNAGRVSRAMSELRKAAPDSGSYVAESGYFERDWQRSYWGQNYPRLLAIKKKYDPEGLFFVHHGVGSEDWSDDGFMRMSRAAAASRS
jgi:FAD/FMN-containing dehydrogenase